MTILTDFGLNLTNAKHWRLNMLSRLNLDLFKFKNMSDEKLLQFLIGIVYTELLEGVVFKLLESENIEEPYTSV